MIYEKAICSCHGKLRFIVNKTHVLCSEGVYERNKENRKPKKAVNKISVKQAEINNKYFAMLKDFDIFTPKVCEGCGSKNKPLTHSHIVARGDCKKHKDLIPLIYDKNNVQYLCYECHEKWHGQQRNILLCYEKNMTYISKVSEQMYFKYRVTNQK